MRATDNKGGGCEWIIQGSHAAAGRMDGDGFSVSVAFIQGGETALIHYSMLGSLTLYRRLLLENVFSNPHIRSLTPFKRGTQSDYRTLPSFGHGIAGIMAGTTVCFIAAPVEHIKVRLQIQYAADKSKRMYSGPIDCLRRLVSDPALIFYHLGSLLIQTS